MNKMMPLVTIMMPVYNGMPYIEMSIKSLLNQTYQNWECIIVDDGSIDDTLEYLKILTDSRIRVIALGRNYGRAYARQMALDNAQGKYLAMLDADDLYHPCKIARQVSEMEADQNISLVCTSMISFGYHTDYLSKRGSQKDQINNYVASYEPIHASSMLKTDYAKQFRYAADLNFGEDRDFLSKYLSHYPRYMMLAKPYYYYSEYDSVTKTKILKSYLNRVIYYLKKRRLKDLSVTLLKYVYSCLTLPFISNDAIIKRRGWDVQDYDRKEFESVLTALNNVEIANSDLEFDYGK